MNPVIVFDLDDTLYPERDFVLSGFRAVDAWLRRERGAHGFEEIAGELFAQGRRGRIFDEALAPIGLGATDELIAAMVAVYRTHEPTLILFADATRALERLRDATRLGVITDGYASAQRKKIAALGVEKYVDHVICTDELGGGCWKPSPVAFQQMMSRFACQPEVCVYVGDNPAKDFVAPNRLGWLSVRIRRSGGEHASAGAELPEENCAQREIVTLDELPRILAETFGGVLHSA